MDDRKYFYAPKVYDPPSDYSASNGHLSTDTNHPELNSLNYAFEALKGQPETRGFLPVFCFLSQFPNGNLILGTNSFVSAITSSNVIGSKNFDCFAKKDLLDIDFQLPAKGIITGLKALEDSLFLVARRNGELQLNSLPTPIRDDQLLKPFKAGELTTYGSVKAIEKLHQQSRLIVGTSEGELLILNYGRSEVFSESNYEYAHTDVITGVSSHPSEDDKWASCSLDFSCLIWDKRLEFPALAMLDDHPTQLTAVHWTTAQENNELLVVGDETGNVLSLDPRQPKKILFSTKVAKRAVTGFSFKGSKEFGIATKTKTAKVYKTCIQNGFEPVYEHNSPDVIIYEMHWDKIDEKSFYVVGEEKYAEKITMT